MLAIYVFFPLFSSDILWHWHLENIVLEYISSACLLIFKNSVARLCGLKGHLGLFLFFPLFFFFSWDLDITSLSLHIGIWMDLSFASYTHLGWETIATILSNYSPFKLGEIWNTEETVRRTLGKEYKHCDLYIIYVTHSGL